MSAWASTCSSRRCSTSSCRTRASTCPTSSSRCSPPASRSARTVYDGYWLDIGRHDDYEQAIAEFEELKDTLWPEQDPEPGWARSTSAERGTGADRQRGRLGPRPRHDRRDGGFWRARAEYRARAQMVWMRTGARRRSSALRASGAGPTSILVEPFTGADVRLPRARAPGRPCPRQRRGLPARPALALRPPPRRGHASGRSDQLARFHRALRPGAQPRGRAPPLPPSPRTPGASCRASIHVRRSYTYLPGERPAASRTVRGLRNALIAALRHRRTGSSTSASMHPALGRGACSTTSWGWPRPPASR